MPAAAQSAAPAVANDNRLHPMPAPVAPADVATLPIGTPISDERGTWSGVVLVWAALAGVLAAAEPDIAWAGFAGAGALALAAVWARSRVATVAAGALGALTLLVVWAGSGGAGPVFAALAAGGLGTVLLGWAVRLRSGATAGLLTLSALLSIAAATALAADPLVLFLPATAAVCLALGTARAGVNRGVAALEGAYTMLWCAAVTCAALAQLKALPTPSAQSALMAGILFAAAALVWATSKRASVLTLLTVAAAFTLAAWPEGAARAFGGLDLHPTLLPPLIAGGVAAAGLAMCARGLARGRTLPMVLGAAVAVGQVAVVAARSTLTVEDAVAFAASFTVCALWAFALRFR